MLLALLGGVIPSSAQNLLSGAIPTVNADTYFTSDSGWKFYNSSGTDMSSDFYSSSKNPKARARAPQNCIQSGGSKYTGSCFLIRWDGFSNAVYSYPVTLEENKFYTFTMNVVHWNNSNNGVIAGLNANVDGRGTVIASVTATGINSANNGNANANLKSYTFNARITKADTYYVTFKNGDNGIYCIADNLSLVDADISVYESNWQVAYDAAVAARDNGSYTNITGNERSALQTEIEKTKPSTKNGYFSAMVALEEATATFTSAKSAYDFYKGIKDENTAMGATTLAIEPTTAEEATAGGNTLKVNQYTYVSENYSGDVTDLFAGSWTTKTNFDEVTNTEHWSGTSTKYFNKWAAKGTTSTLSQTMSLPAGSYVLKVAGRGTGPVLTFSDGTTTKKFQLLGGTGVGINLDGEASYDAEDATGFANTTGRGWEWRFIKLTLADATDVAVTLQINRSSDAGWGSFADFTLLTTPLAASLCRYNMALASATSARDAADYTNVKGVERAELEEAIDADESLDKTSTTDLDAASSTLTTKTTAFTAAKTSYDALATAISNASTIITTGANVGSEAFQIPASAQTTLSDAKTAAEGVRDADDTTASGASSAATTLNDAITTYNAAELNAPTAGKRYQIVNVTPAASFDYSGKALTFYVNPSQTEGGYGYQYRLNPDINYAQGFIFTAVDGQTNVYTLSYEGLDGTTRYICSQYGYNENASGDKTRIRTTTNSTYALKIRVDVTTTANVWKLYNTEAEKNIGTNGKENNDFFTNADRSDIKLQEVEQASVDVNINSSVKLATRIFPFTPVLPSGVKAYSCEAVADDVLTLVAVAEPAANTPYILYAKDGYTGDALTGYGTATADTYTEGLLTGVYTETAALNESYVLQKNGDVVAFYQVDTSVATPSVGAYRCYLTTSGEARALHFRFADDETTGIKSLTPDPSPIGEGSIYTLNGQRVENPTKGLYIINGKKVVIK